MKASEKIGSIFTGIILYFFPPYNVTKGEFYQSSGSRETLATGVSNHGRRLNTQPRALSSYCCRTASSQMRLIPPPRAKMGSIILCDLTGTRCQADRGRWCLQNETACSHGGGGSEGVMLLRFGIAGTICCLVATWAQERLVKINAACNAEDSHSVYTFKCTFFF